MNKSGCFLVAAAAKQLTMFEIKVKQHLRVVNYDENSMFWMNNTHQCYGIIDTWVILKGILRYYRFNNKLVIHW